MTDPYLVPLIRKYLSNDISREELDQLNDWKNTSRENQRTFDTLVKYWNKPLPVSTYDGPTETSIHEIWQKGTMDDSQHSTFGLWPNFLKVAAILLLVLGLGFFGLKKLDTDQSPTVVNTDEVIKISPPGQKMKTILPDGTIVWLNSDSRISYSPAFNQTTREVYLVGEAYFEVAESPDKPFSVTSYQVKTTALGTSFNINAYPEERDVQVSLFTGKVDVEMPGEKNQKAHLVPGNELVFSKMKQTNVTREFQQESILGWKSGILSFKGDDYAATTKKLERWFGIQVITQGHPPRDWRLTTEYQNENLTNILTNLQYGNQFEFELKDKVLTIQF